MNTKAAVSTLWSAEAIRSEFPILQQQVNGQALVYLDNAATTQKPQAVIDAVSSYYACDNANVHRAAHVLSDRATQAFENARTVVAKFINSPQTSQVIWTRGTTEAINLVANSFGTQQLKAGDTILVSTLEHHSNIVPWQLLAEKVGARVLPIPINALGEIDLEQYAKLLNDRVKLVAVNQVSNALGTINPLKKMIEMAHDCGAKVLVDGAQSVAHFEVDVQALDCDFFAFSGHKVYGPTGIGVLWGKNELLQAMPPYQGGGEMIETVSFEGTTYNELPYKFEAGTPNIAGAVGMAAALEFVAGQPREAVLAHEQDLLNYCVALGDAAGLQRIGKARQATGVYSFLIPGTHPADVGMLLDQQGVAVRTGHHCAQPIMTQFAIPGTVRASFSMYNTRSDIDRLFQALEKAKAFLL